MCVAYSPDGRWVASDSSDNTIKIWDAETGRELLTLKGHSEPVDCLAFSPDGRRVGSGSEGNGGEGLARVWDAETARELIEPIQYAPTAPGEGIGKLAFSPDFRRMVGGLRNGNVKVYDLETGRELFKTGRVRQPRPCGIGSTPWPTRPTDGGLSAERMTALWKSGTWRNRPR